LPTHALELKFALQFLDAVIGTTPDAADDLARIRSAILPDGRLHVGGGLDDEFVNVLDFAPHPATPARRLFDDADVGRALDRLEGEQQADGGWPCAWAAYSPIATLEWRGWLTVHAVSMLRDNART
jgi:hypothetical protein